MGRKKQEPTFIKSIRVNQRKASLNVVKPLGGTTFK